MAVENSFVPAISSAALYGKGVFTTLAIYTSKPFLWEKHWRRLQENSAKLKIDLSKFDEETVKNALSQIILQNRIETGRARLTFFDESASEVWNFESNRKTGFLITTADWRESKRELLLAVSPFPINSKSPLVNIKSCNYLENLLAFEEARKCGFDESIRFNEKGEIVSASMANIFWVKNEKVFTPGLETGCLAGTTREFLMDNFAVQEVKADLTEIIEADAIFLTSSGIGICPANLENTKRKSQPMVSKLTRFFDFHNLKASTSAVLNKI